MESRGYLSLTVLGLLVLLGVYLGYGFFTSNDNTPEAGSKASPNKEKEQTLSEFTLNETLEDGERWILNSPRANRDGDTVRLQSPYVEYRVDGDTTMIISAKKGYYALKSQRLTLIDSVRLNRVNKNQILETDRLQWDRANKRVYTESPVVLRMPRGTLRARGMKTKLKEETIQFLSNVRYSSN